MVFWYVHVLTFLVRDLENMITRSDLTILLVSSSEICIHFSWLIFDYSKTLYFKHTSYLICCLLWYYLYYLLPNSLSSFMFLLSLFPFISRWSSFWIRTSECIWKEWIIKASENSIFDRYYARGKTFRIFKEYFLFCFFFKSFHCSIYNIISQVSNER